MALLTLGFIIYVTWTSNVKTLDKHAKESLEELAFNTMDKIDRALFEKMIDLETITNDPVITSRYSNPQQITERLIEYRDIYKTYVSLSFFNLNRVRVADTSGLVLGKQESKHKYWEDVLQGRLSIASDISFSETLGVPVINFAAPVKGRNNQPFGVVVTKMSPEKLYEIIGKLNIVP